MTKKELRVAYRATRLALSERDRMKLDDLLLIQFQKLSFENVQAVLSYMPMPHTAEPSTHLFSRYLAHLIPGLQIAYPVTDFTATSLQAITVDEDTEFAMNEFGITEPVSNNVIPPQDIDLVFVPMLICDSNGYRVGYGKGFYDRYLQQCREDILKISFSYFEPVARIDDINEHDVPIDYCITPHLIYEF